MLPQWCGCDVAGSLPGDPVGRRGPAVLPGDLVRPEDRALGLAAGCRAVDPACGEGTSSGALFALLVQVDGRHVGFGAGDLEVLVRQVRRGVDPAGRLFAVFLPGAPLRTE